MKRLYLLFIAVFLLNSCLEKTKEKEYHGEPRIFTHPDTGMEYYYEVPRGSVVVYEMAGFCENLDYEGEGWRWANIDDLRSLVINCSNTSTDGLCKVTNENYDQSYFDYDECSCSELESTNDNSSRLFSLIQKNDEEKIGRIAFSSTAAVYIADTKAMEYYYVVFSGTGSICKDSAYNNTDPICVREGKTN